MGLTGGTQVFLGIVDRYRLNSDDPPGRVSGKLLEP